jgi:hypothetical protein
MGIRSRSAPKNRCARAFGLLRSAAATATVGAHVGCAISCISPFVLQTRDDLLWRQEREDWNCGSPFPSAVGVKRAGFFFLFQGRTFVVKIAVQYDCDLPWLLSILVLSFRRVNYRIGHTGPASVYQHSGRISRRWCVRGYKHSPASTPGRMAG